MEIEDENCMKSSIGGILTGFNKLDRAQNTPTLMPYEIKSITKFLFVIKRLMDL